MYKSFFKPFSDFIFSLLAFAVLSPVFFLVAILLAISNSGNPFFFQIRPGKNEKMFLIVKFKTMTNQKNDNGTLLPDEKRVTKLGKLIRQTSLDEIPQLINVIKGDMSLVGPRPLLPEYLLLYNEEERKRQTVKPGITGWAQINGRNAISWQKKFEYDVWYVNNLSFLVDLKIIALTIKKVLVSHGVYQNLEKSVDVFKGSNL